VLLWHPPDVQIRAVVTEHAMLWIPARAIWRLTVNIICGPEQIAPDTHALVEHHGTNLKVDLILNITQMLNALTWENATEQLENASALMVLKVPLANVQSAQMVAVATELADQTKILLWTTRKL